MLTCLTSVEGSRPAGATCSQPHRPTVIRQTLSRIKSKLVPFLRAPLLLHTLAEHMQSKEPVLLETPNFDADVVKAQLLQYCSTDTSNYRGLGGQTKVFFVANSASKNKRSRCISKFQMRNPLPSFTRSFLRNYVLYRRRRIITFGEGTSFSTEGVLF